MEDKGKDEGMLDLVGEMVEVEVDPTKKKSLLCFQMMSHHRFLMAQDVVEDSVEGVLCQFSQMS